MVGRQPYTPAAFTLREIPGTHFQSLSRPQDIWFRRSHGKKSPVTPTGIEPGTVGLVAQCLNHYTIPGPVPTVIWLKTFELWVELNNCKLLIGRANSAGYMAPEIVIPRQATFDQRPKFARQSEGRIHLTGTLSILHSLSKLPLFREETDCVPTTKP